MRLNVGNGLRIDTVELPDVPGRLGLCACPGGRWARVRGPDSRVDMLRDVGTIVAYQAAGVVSLVDEDELAFLAVDTLALELTRAGLWWKHLPIADMGVPSKDFEARWESEGAAIRESLASGEHVVMHCWAGLGRTGTIAARLLVEFGMDPPAAILRVRDARPGAIQTRKQERYVLRQRPV